MNFVFLVSLQTRNRMFRVLGFLSLSRSSITSYLSTDWPKAFQCLSLLCFFYPELEMPPARWLVCPEPRVVDYCRAWLSRQRQAILVERPRAVTARDKAKEKGNFHQCKIQNQELARQTLRNDATMRGACREACVEGSLMPIASRLKHWMQL